MKKILEGYIYLHFFLNNAIKNVKGNHLVSLKTGFALGILNMAFGFSLLIELMLLIRIDFIVKFPWWCFAFLLGMNIFGFWVYDFKKTGKRQESIFEQWSKAKRKKWDWIMRLVILLALGNLFFSFYWMFHTNPMDLH